MADAFFEGIYQIEAESAGEEVKCPIFYRDARSFTAVFAADWFKLRRMLPDWRYFPAQVLPGVGAVGFTAFEYYDTDIRPYNEFAVTIMLNSPYLAPLPGYNLLRQYFHRSFEAYVYHLPVTTEVALRAGIDFYNYPKFLAGIDFSEDADEVACDLTHEGRRICRLVSRKLPANRSYEAKFFCRLYQDRQPQGAEFKVNVREGADRWMPSTVRLELGDHDIARNFRSVLLSTRPLLHFYWPSIQCCLYGPERLSLPLVHYGMQQAGAPGGPEKGPKPSAVTEHRNW